jgi:hypothetical protein
MLEDYAIEHKMHLGMMGDELHEIAATLFCQRLGWNPAFISGQTKRGHVFVLLTKEQERKLNAV